MNSLVHNVTKFIDKQGVIKNFYLFCGYILNNSADKDDTISKCFINYPIEFARLYEEMTDIMFNVEDEEIIQFVKETFNKENIERRRMENETISNFIERYDEMIGNNCNNALNGFITLMMLLSLTKFSSWSQYQINEENDQHKY